MDVSETMYQHLRAIAGRYLRDRPGHTLQPTALVNEAYLKLGKRDAEAFESREHFMAVAARAMRGILVDHVRRRTADKRGGGEGHVTLSGVASDDTTEIVDVLALDDALTTLAELNERHAKVVELRFFGGLTTDEIARALDISGATVERDWVKARAWLLVQMRTGIQ